MRGSRGLKFLIAKCLIEKGIFIYGAKVGLVFGYFNTELGLIVRYF
jgi:hypothetical protein